MEDIVVQGRSVWISFEISRAGALRREAKTLIQAGMVKVNGRTERRRGFSSKTGIGCSAAAPAAGRVKE